MTTCKLLSVSAALAAAVLVLVGTSAQAALIGYWSFDNSSNRYEESSGWAQSAAGGSQASGFFDAEDIPVSESEIDTTTAFNNGNGIIGYYADMTGAGNEALRVKNSNANYPGSGTGKGALTLHNDQSASFSVWIYGWAADDGDVYLGKDGRQDPPFTSNHGYGLRRSDGNNAAAEWSRAENSGDGTLGDNAWHHLVGVATRNPTGTKFTISLYVDGIKDGSDGSTNDPKYTDDPEYLTFGAIQLANLGDWDYFSNVKLDDIGIWANEALSAKQIAAIHAMGRFEAIGLMDAGVDNLIAAFDAGAGNSTTINGHIWEYTDLSSLSTTVGATGGTAGVDAWVVLDSSGNGMQLIPEPGTIALLAAALAAMALYGWRRRKKDLGI